jgi:hypothetical protein
MVIEDSEVLKIRIECTLDADGIFGYTKEEKIEKLKGFKTTITDLLQNWMYPKKEYDTLHQLQNDIDNHLVALNGS